MKTTLTTLRLAALLALAALLLPRPAAAQPAEGLAVWAGGGTDVGTTLCYTVVSANGRNGQAPVLTYLSATADNATNTVKFYTVGAPARCVTTNTTVTIPVASTNGFGSGDIVVIRHHLTDTYERRVLDTLTISTNLVTTVAPGESVVPGDLIYKATYSGAFIPVGNATIGLAGNGLYAGQAGKPLLLEVTGAAACQVNAACANYPQ